MVEGIRELRKKCQDPVSAWQDLSGQVYGCRLSIYFTRFFLELGLAPAWVSILMALCGFCGALLLLFPGVFPIAGILLLILHYILDCSDGEVARYLQKEDIRWTLYDYLIHYFVKPTAFISLGLGAYLRDPGKGWIFLFSFSCLLSVILEKVARELFYIIYCKNIRGFRGKISEESLSLAFRKMDRLEAGKGKKEEGRSAFRNLLSFLRVAIVTFEIYMFFFLAGAFVDLYMPPSGFFGWGLNLKELLLIFYGVLLPLHFLDYLICYIKRNSLFLEIHTLSKEMEKDPGAGRMGKRP